MWSLPALGPADLGSYRSGSLGAGTPARAAGEDPAQRLLDHFRATGPDRFFAGPGDDATPALFARLAPAARDRAVAAAESVREGRFDLLGYRSLSFGDPVDWQLDPVSGRRSPLVHWSLIDPTDAAALGDSKVVWELSRQQFLVTLGIAYRATGDERHAEAFAALIQAWMRGNPAGMGRNWASSLEVALRIVSWSWALVLFRRSSRLTPELFRAVRTAIGAHAAHVQRYLSRHFSPNTHLTGEALGLLYAGVLFPESRGAARWRSVGQGILDEQIDRQVLRDGFYFERATAYQVYTVEIYLHYLMLAARNHLAVSAGIRERVQQMLDVLLALRRPDGGMPAIGDADGGSVLPVVSRAPGDLRGVFAIAAEVFGRPEYRWAAEGAQPEALWFLGPEAARAVTPDAHPPREASRVFADGGYVVMRSGWQPDAHHLVFDVGPLGCPLSGAHGHADLLSVQISPFGQPHVVDPGTYAYAERALRDHFRGTRAHATVMVDGRGQAEPRGPFAWRQRPEARLRHALSTPVFDLADASHDAYRRLPDPVVHRRRVVFVKSPGYWLIADDLTGTAEHGVELRFQFAPLPVWTSGDGWVRAARGSGRGLLVKAHARESLQIRIREGSHFPLEGWVSPSYGQREPAPVLIYSARARLPLHILTVLLPVEDVDGLPPCVEPIPDAQGEPRAIAFPDWNQCLRFGTDAFTIESLP